MEADGILVNSHHSLPSAAALKVLRPSLTFVHRLDGLLGLSRAGGDRWDRLIFEWSRAFADGVVFQSDYSQMCCTHQGLAAPRSSRVILNAPSLEHFFPAPSRPDGPVCRIIATSWSDNEKKGFDLYLYLDQNLDFTRYEMTFVGNARIKFRNIKMVGPVDSASVGVLLREHDLFLTASRDDACSNSLIEGLHCGLAAVAIRSGGNEQVVGAGGVLFNGSEDVIDAIAFARANRARLREGFALPSISTVAAQYREAFQEASNARQSYAGRPRLTLRSVRTWWHWIALQAARRWPSLGK
jgi:glycosyltransferase involved in cell wall biosynthesis